MAIEAKNEQRLTFILAELAKGNADRAIILAKCVDLWQISTRTFDRLWKKAREKYTGANQEAQKQITDTLTAEAVEGLQSAIKSDMELEMILCQIAGGNVQVEDWIGGKAVLRKTSPNEITGAIAQLFKKRGSYAPTKIAQTDSKGKDIPIQLIKLPDNGRGNDHRAAAGVPDQGAQ